MTLVPEMGRKERGTLQPDEPKMGEWVCRSCYATNQSFDRDCRACHSVRVQPITDISAKSP